jgi:RHS repeat-associated protein
MDYMLARYYSSGLARFPSVDPVSAIGKNLRNAQRWNRYTYAGKNPLRYFDPDGREYTEVDTRFAAGIRGIRSSGSATGNKTLDAFAKNTSNPSTGKVSDGAAWGVRDANDKDVGRVFKADGSRPTKQEITDAGGVKAVPRAGESSAAERDDQGNVTKEGFVAVYLGSKQYDPSAAGMTDQQFVEKIIVHETTHQNGATEQEADTAEADYVKETKKPDEE